MKKSQATVEEHTEGSKISLQEFVDSAPYSHVLIAGMESWCKDQTNPRKRTYSSWVQAFEEFASSPSE